MQLLREPQKHRPGPEGLLQGGLWQLVPASGSFPSLSPLSLSWRGPCGCADLAPQPPGCSRAVTGQTPRGLGPADPSRQRSGTSRDGGRSRGCDLGDQTNTIGVFLPKQRSNVWKPLLVSQAQVLTVQLHLSDETRTVRAYGKGSGISVCES